jgi:uncharacterized membrane protein YheB (UPF0754 family)
MNWIYVLIPLTTAFAGWLANWLLIKLILNWALPKRQQQMAATIGQLVSKELFSFNEIEAKLMHPDNIKKILPQVEQHIDEFLRHRLKEAFPMIGMFIGEKTINQLKQVFMTELENIFPVVLKNYMTNLQKDLDIEKMVTQKLSSFPIQKLESALYGSMGKELRLATLIGALAGLGIGLLQVLLIIVLEG